MKLAGIDPSSSCTGVALVESSQLRITDAWRRPKRGSAPSRLLDCFDWLTGWLILWRPDMAVVESLSVERNAKTTRVVSHYQAICVLACARLEIPVVEAMARTARAVVLGNGGLAKEEVFVAVKQLFPEHRFGNYKIDGGDKTDATVLALAGPKLVENA